MLQDLKETPTRVLFAELQAIQTYLRKPEVEKTEEQIALFTNKLRQIKAELTSRDAFKPKTGSPSVNSGENHGVATFKQSAPPPLEDLEAELAISEDEERIIILKRAIAARTK